jgi:ribonuclease P protein component
MPRDARPQGLSRRHRFNRRGSFGPVLQGGRKLRGRYAVVHLSRNAQAASRLGVALTRRFVPSAVERNRVKRLVREAFRRHGIKSAAFDCVVMLRGRLEPAQHQAALEEIRALLDQALAAPASK